MSKQSNDQDEKQTSSGAKPRATSDADSEAKTTEETKAMSSGASDVEKPAKGRPETRSRGKRRGKSNAAPPPASTTELDVTSSNTSQPKAAPSSAAPAGANPSSADTSSAQLAQSEQGEGAHDTPAQSKAPEASKPDPAKPGETKPSNSKPGDAKPDKGKPDAAKPDEGKLGQDTPKARTTDAKPAAAVGTGSGGRSGSGGPPRDGRRSGGKFGLVALVLAVLIGIALIIVAWQGWERLDAQQQRLAELETDQQARGESLSEIESRLEESADERDAALNSALQSMRQEFGDYREEVNQTLDRVLDELSSVQETDEREWLHAEAAYLLRLANQRLQLERDVEGAAALLRTADARLADADNPALMPVRREIASELAELDSVPRVDRTGLYLALDAQQQQLSRMPLQQDIEQIAAEPGEDSPPTGTWQQQLARFGGELRDLVTVRRHDEELEALISPQQESYLRQNVRVLVEQAQLALLQEEQELYEASLDKAMRLVENYYDTDRDGVQRSLERLSELRDATIRPELPDISGSQQALAEFIERRFNGGRGGNGDQGDAV